MLSLVVALLTTIVVAWLIIKRMKPQAVLFAGGIFLLAVAILMGYPVLDAKKSTGLSWFDIFKFIEDVFSNRAAGIGLMIMTVGGFAKYMDYIGASRSLVYIASKPLSMVKSPYVLLGISYIIGQLLNIVIPSAAGLCVLLMATMYPVLVNLGVSRLSAAAVVATTPCLDLGSASGSAVFAAKTAGLDVADYFVAEQIPIAVVTMVAIAVSHYFVQRYFDRKEGLEPQKLQAVSAHESETENLPPKIYALLPMIPIIFVLVFSKLGISSIKMSVVTTMIISIFIAMILEVIRTRRPMEVCKNIQVFFDGMGHLFATVVTLIVAGETFAYGLTKIGAIDMIIKGAQGSGFGAIGVTLIMTLIVAIAAVIMGSGNAPFYSFGALVPDIAKGLSMMPAVMITPMQMASSIARSASPITAAVVAVAGVADVSPVDLVKRTAIPMGIALVVSFLMAVIF
ncbi:C4-dicarboxylate transporter DcuC [Veillonella seminalis]|uniref:Anaerobic C4-dicarboxylate uptake C (DcuC) family transporter n=1 Tax=Veillonella seminalis ACS-216-V-Col6b TaxID=883156 RepID=K9DH74_9FIRM|nr:C4-dicarboxylate transporter DcuC [Veillonella seminalis]EKU78177.1 anaerobic C4-dicarboxylate uptake C (DcuC) family transporter [Veillonella seminalis ACS-216-V-Col6b]